MFHELLHLSTLPRRISFPFPLAIFSCSEGLAAGHVVRRLESELEFCFRFSSTEKEAEDCIDDHAYRTGFPFLLIRKPDILHKHRINGVREALSLYYNGDLMEKFESIGFDLTLPGRSFVRTEEIDALVSRMRGLTGIIELPGIVEKMDLLAFQLLETVFLQVQAAWAPSAAKRSACAGSPPISSFIFLKRLNLILCCAGSESRAAVFSAAGRSSTLNRPPATSGTCASAKPSVS